jgi:hypothetical protein
VDINEFQLEVDFDRVSYIIYDISGPLGKLYLPPLWF